MRLFAGWASHALESTERCRAPRLTDSPKLNHLVLTLRVHCTSAGKSSGPVPAPESSLDDHLPDPYRVSFAGGGTDLPAFYRHEPGAVLSITIERYIYVTVHRRFEPTIRVGYSDRDRRRVDEIQHELVREAMRLTGVDSYSRSPPSATSRPARAWARAAR